MAVAVVGAAGALGVGERMESELELIAELERLPESH
jgi:hypothetical protein